MYPPGVWTESLQDSFGLCHCWHTFQEGRGSNAASACTMHRVPEGGAVTGPPRPSVYCSVKCFGGQKPGAALKDVASNRLMNIRNERGRAGAWAESFGAFDWGGVQAKRAPGSHGTKDGSQLTPSEVSMLWHVYRSGVFFHNKTTSSSRVAEPHKKAWFTCWGSDRPPPPLPVALTLHFLWARVRPSGVINNHSTEWGKVKFPLHVQEECLSPAFCCPTS